MRYIEKGTNESTEKTMKLQRKDRGWTREEKLSVMTDKPSLKSKLLSSSTFPNDKFFLKVKQNFNKIIKGKFLIFFSYLHERGLQQYNTFIGILKIHLLEMFIFKVKF